MGGMNPFGAVELAGKAGLAYLRRSRVAVTVNEDYDTFSANVDESGVRSFFFPVDTPEQLTQLSGNPDRLIYTKPHRWVVKNNGYVLGSTAFEFAVQSLNATVALIGGKPVVYEGIEETRGIAVVPPPAGGPTTGSFLSVSLDEESIDCRGGDNPGAPSIPFRYEIRQGETAIFRVIAHSTHPRAWFLRLVFVVNGKKVQYDVRRENDEDFVTLPVYYDGITASYRWERDHWEQVETYRRHRP
ncbi:hypothetical protein BN977_00272 [Mycolicibacterium cosmeticum]|uniref:Uncharacterized protein n=2 Tax=Mycolicibacterium cosmeticum TaxID=258533 RepID=W9AJ62_MYCCO|nr:hypothetical protein BN977_00272 [Mycolicibacterium cosmeticum]